MVVDATAKPTTPPGHRRWRASPALLIGYRRLRLSGITPAHRTFEVGLAAA